MKGSNIYGITSLNKLDCFSDDITAIARTITKVELKQTTYGPKWSLKLGNHEFSYMVGGNAWNTIAAAYGDDSLDWIGKPVEAYPASIKIDGVEKKFVGIRIPTAPVNDVPPEKIAELRAAQAAAEAEAEAKARADGEIVDDIPF